MRDSVYVKSDVDSLQKVIIHPIGKESRHIVPRFAKLGIPGFCSDILGSDAPKQHEAFTKVLKSCGIEVLNTYDLINNSIQNLKKENKFDSWLQDNFPEFHMNEIKDCDVTAETLTGAGDSGFYQFDESAIHIPSLLPLPGMFYIRDVATMLPEGILLTNFGNKRTTEAILAELMFLWSDELKDIPIVFDAKKEDVEVQGGDLIVLNEKILLMGIDNMSERKAAESLAIKLKKRVIGVVLPTQKKNCKSSFAPFSSLFLHLDSVFNLVDHNKCLVAPYFFENRYRENNPIYSVLEGAKSRVAVSFKRDLDVIIDDLKRVGDVIEFEPLTGRQTNTDKKLVDYLKKELDMEIIYSCGERPDTFEKQVKHMIEVVLPEIRFQATNVVVINPGRVLMYKDDTVMTQLSLSKAKVETVFFSGTELARWNGGPHCMTLPLIRV